MNWKRLLISLIFTCTAPLLAAETTDVRTALEKHLASDFTEQKLFGQAAQFDNFDFKPALKSAIEKKESALAELFRCCERTTLIGAGAEEHAYILKLLLQHWGDEAFVKVLRVQSAEAKQKVIWDLDYAFVEDFKKRFCKWSFKNEPLWKGCGIHSRLSNLSLLDPYHDTIKTWLEEDMDYTASLSIL